MGLHTLALTLRVVLRRAAVWAVRLARPDCQSRRPLVGFSDKVTLGELGQIIESRDEVMRVRFFDQANDAPQPVHGEIYLQGAC